MLHGSKRKRESENVFGVASENLRKKHRKSLSTVFSQHNTHSKKNDSSIGDVPESTPHARSQQPPANQPLKQTQTKAKTTEPNKVLPINYEEESKIQTEKDWEVREFAKAHIHELLKKTKFHYDARNIKNATDLIHKIKDFKDTLNQSYKNKFSESFIIAKVETGMKNTVLNRWKNHLKLLEMDFHKNFPNRMKNFKTVDVFTKWIIKDLNLREAFIGEYNRLQKFKASTWKPTVAINEFKLLMEKHEYTGKYTSEDIKTKFSISIPDQILIVLNSLHTDTQKFIKQLKLNDNYADIRYQELRLKEQGKELTAEQMKKMQEDITWDTWAQFTKHAQMYENYCLTRKNYEVYSKTPQNTRVRQQPQRKQQPSKSTQPSSSINAIQYQQPTSPRKYGLHNDPMYHALGDQATIKNGKYLDTQKVKDYIVKHGDESAYRPVRCIRPIGKNKLCNQLGHNSYVHDAVMQLKGLAARLERRYHGEHPNKEQHPPKRISGRGTPRGGRGRSNNRSTRGRGRGRGGRGRGGRGRGKGRGRPGWNRFRNNNKNDQSKPPATPTINLLQQMNKQPDGYVIEDAATAPAAATFNVGVMNQSHQ